MTTMNHLMLGQKISAESRLVTAIAGALVIPAAYCTILSRSAYMIYLLKKVLRELDRFDREYCVPCTLEGCTFDIADDLKSARDGIRMVLSKDTINVIPSLIRKSFEDLANRMDDKIDNYSLAADQEVKQMMAGLADRMRSRAHAIH